MDPLAANILLRRNTLYVCEGNVPFWGTWGSGIAEFLSSCTYVDTSGFSDTFSTAKQDRFVGAQSLAMTTRVSSFAASAQLQLAGAL